MPSAPVYSHPRFRKGALAALVLGCLPMGPLRAQEAAAATAPAAKDYSREAGVFERFHQRMRYEQDGTGRRDLEVRLKVQNEAGVQRFGQLVIGYASGNERVDIQYVRVRKADGTVVTAGANDVQDLAPISAQSAPEYSDYRQKHVTVPGLRPGDVLEYAYAIVVTQALAPGHFWGEYEFFDRPICLDEVLEVDLPRTGVLKLKHAPEYQPKIQEEGDRRIYRWTHAQLKTAEDLEKEAKEKKADRAKGKKKPKAWVGPDVAFSTFQSWEQVGRWYAGLEKDRRVATPELKAKAAELTKGQATDEACIEALYDYVARTNRYVSLSFGAGRFQPHAASTTFANQYGDCKDKHTLLAALLSAAGYDARAVLIHTDRKLDEDLPSPTQFNHVITQVKLGDRRLWMDTTAEIAPFRMLMPVLRHKKALVVPAEGAPGVEETPLDPPFPCFERSVLTAKLDAKGALKGRMDLEVRGDAELGIRSLLRRTPESQWKDQMKAGFSRVFKLGKLEAFELSLKGHQTTGQPMVVGGEFTAPGYLAIPEKEGTFQPPIDRFSLASFPEDDPDKEPIRFGGETEFDYRMQLEVPPGVTVKPMLPVTLNRDYAEFRSEYQVEGTTLRIHRSLKLLKREVPYDRKDDWASFVRTVDADQSQSVGLETPVPIGDSTAQNQADPDEVYASAVKAHQERRFQEAADLYAKTLQLDPDHKEAWSQQARCYLGLREYEKALVSLGKVVEKNPYDEWAYHLMAIAYQRLGKNPEAIKALTKQVEVSPLHPASHSLLAAIYMDQRQWKEALGALDKASSISPKESWIRTEIGRAYLNLGESEKAMAAFDQALKIESSPAVWNNVAYQLSLHQTQLDRALQYAESAVTTVASGLRNQDLSQKAFEQQQTVASLCSYWDTLGWIHFQRGDLPQADRYVRAAWELALHGEVGDHLGQIAEKQGDRASAIRYYALALSATKPEPDTRERLEKLVGAGRGADQAIAKVKGDLLANRTVDLGVKGTVDAQGDCYVAFLPTGEVQEVYFTPGSEALKALESAIRKARFAYVPPKELNARTVRRALLTTRKGGASTLVFFPADALAGTRTDLR